MSEGSSAIYFLIPLFPLTLQTLDLLLLKVGDNVVSTEALLVLVGEGSVDLHLLQGVLDGVDLRLLQGVLGRDGGIDLHLLKVEVGGGEEEFLS